MLRHAVRVNSLTELAVTKLDVLDTLDTVKVCVAYEIDGQRVERLPYHQSDLHRVVPIYEELPGWQTDLSAATASDHLPDAAKRYLALIEEQVGVPITLVSTGPRSRPVPALRLSSVATGLADGGCPSRVNP